jgi:hypothetical protein
MVMPFHIFNRLVVFFSVCFIIFSLGACNTPPDHARYIPADALMVTGLNTKSISRKVAWNIITGSKLFKQMQEQMADKNAMNLDESGIDVINTFYVYIKSNGSMAGNKLTTLVPIANADKWEAYVKKVFPAATIKAQGVRRLAVLGNGLYAGWNSKLLIIMNALPNPQSYTDSAIVPAYSTIGDSLVAVDMENAFSVTKENALTENARFAKLLKEGHDITFWVNYDPLMTQYMSQGLSKMINGITLSNVLWKDAALAAGMDFDKGKITGDMHYYVGDDMREAAKELGGTSVDKDMLDRLPKQGLDMAMCLHLSPKGLKAMLDKTGLLGIANLALSMQGMNTDYVLDAFTGDMAIVVNDLDMKKTGSSTDTMQYNRNAYNGYNPEFNALYVLKINKKENFEKLFQLGMQGNMLRIDSNTYAIPVTGKDSVVIMTSGSYAMITNKTINAVRYTQGSNKGQKNNLAKIYGHPFSMYADVQQMLKWLNPNIMDDTLANKRIESIKNLVQNTLITGGAYNNNAFNYHFDINFTNKDESSLLTLMDFAMKVQQPENIIK